MGQTTLHRCARDDNVQACRLLLSYGIDYTIVSLQGYTAAQLASENVLKILKSPPDPGDLEVQLLESAKSGDLDTVKKIVMANPHTVNCRDLDGRHSTPLHFAAGISFVLNKQRIRFIQFFHSYVRLQSCARRRVFVREWSRSAYV